MLFHLVITKQDYGMLSASSRVVLFTHQLLDAFHSLFGLLDPFVIFFYLNFNFRCYCFPCVVFHFHGVVETVLLLLLLLFLSHTLLVLCNFLYISCAYFMLMIGQRYPNGGCWILRIRKKAGQTNTSVLGKMWQVCM